MLTPTPFRGRFDDPFLNDLDIALNCSLFFLTLMLTCYLVMFAASFFPRSNRRDPEQLAYRRDLRKAFLIFTPCWFASLLLNMIIGHGDYVWQALVVGSLVACYALPVGILSFGALFLFAHKIDAWQKARRQHNL